MSEMWNERYAQEDYVYGKQPNDFFKEQLLKLQPGKILLPAEGEGRNAVYAASQGWEVIAFDSSSEAMKKAEKLATEYGVKINYKIDSFEDFNTEENTFDAIALIYSHTTNRQKNHQRLLKSIKPGGVLILEGFSKNQIELTSGGPRKIELLFSKEEIQSDFASLSEMKIGEEFIFLKEGEFHEGYAAVIRLIGIK